MSQPEVLKVSLPEVSLPEVSDRIVTSLRLSAALLQQLHDGMVRRRTAWIAARPSTLQEPARALEHLARELGAESARLRELMAQAQQTLPAPLAHARDLHVDASLLAGHLPAAAAARLRQAAAAATEAARRVRVEQALGERLLRFTQHMQDNLLANIAATLTTTAVDLGGYDRSARRVAGAFGPAATPGSLIDGRI
jgi:hypothetical protein